MAGAENNISFHAMFHIKGGNFTDAGSISSQVKKFLKGAGFSSGVIRRTSIATFEAEMNVICYADRGNLSLFIAPNFLKVVVEDEGIGIPDVNLAMREGYSTANEKIHEMGFGAGMGLSNIKKNTDEMILTSKFGQGTHLEFVISLEGKDRLVPLLSTRE
ncbi:MAG: ATP-binding protein [Desulfobacterales bacterium]|jgi:anti-sigma regulatory factor (Ser/Thr protein kinase)|nr:ATP-binding protein [Desulfobacterales bacterium]